MSMYGHGSASMPSSLQHDVSIEDLAAANGSMAEVLDLDGNMMSMMPMSLTANMGENNSQIYSSIEPSQELRQSGHHHDGGGGGSGEDGVAAANTATGIGAGPLPTGFGAPFNNGGSSTLTEFTKRRNWSQRVLEELRDFLHILTSDGRFLYVSPSVKALTGWEQQELVGKFVGDFIHTDDRGFFVREFNESIATGNALRFFYRFRRNDDTYTIFEAHGHPHLSSEATGYTSSSTTNFCRGFFMMARPYPTKNVELLDSFLEHKTENERLMKRIAALKEEEQHDDAESRASILRRTDTLESGSTSPAYYNGGETPLSVGLISNQSPHCGSMPPPAKPMISNNALTTQNLKEATASSKPDSINDKMARYEGANYIEGIEIMTGLRYRDGERSQGISTGDMSPALIRGDAGIAIPLDKDSRASSDKKKKSKAADEYVCTDCGTLDSPEWRKGPQGPKTLCNACGLRWAKKEKKRQNTGGTTPIPSIPTMPRPNGGGAI